MPSKVTGAQAFYVKAFFSKEAIIIIIFISIQIVTSKTHLNLINRGNNAIKS